MRYASSAKFFYGKRCGLTKVPRDIPHGAVRVTLRDNAIDSLPAGVFKNSSNCETLILNDNQISSLQKESFSGMYSLERLEMYRNQISSIEKGTFCGLVSLTKLHLPGNRITAIDNDTFRGMHSLQYLYLSWNRISSIADAAFCGVESLQFLVLANNKISVLKQGTFLGLKCIKFLHLEHNAISRIEEAVFSTMESIYEIYLHNNRLTSLSPDLFVNMVLPPVRWRLRDKLTSTNQSTNQIYCRDLCWLKHREQLKKFTRFFHLYSVTCLNGSWDSINLNGAWSSMPCSDPGESPNNNNLSRNPVQNISANSSSLFVAGTSLSMPRHNLSIGMNRITNHWQNDNISFVWVGQSPGSQHQKH